MKNQMTPLNIPVPPVPILEQAVGYENTRDARYLALWWEPSGDEAMVSDGFVTFTGHWPGYLAYIHHTSVYCFLSPYNLGSLEDPAEYRLMIDLEERTAYIAQSSESEKILSAQWKQEVTQTEPVSISSEELEELIQSFLVETETLPSMEELLRSMDENRKAVDALTWWLDDR